MEQLHFGKFFFFPFSKLCGHELCVFTTTWAINVGTDEQNLEISW